MAMVADYTLVFSYSSILGTTVAVGSYPLQVVSRGGKLIGRSTVLKFGIISLHLTNIRPDCSLSVNLNRKVLMEIMETISPLHGVEPGSFILKVVNATPIRKDVGIVHVSR